jgi:hypothetical protein
MAVGDLLRRTTLLDRVLVLALFSATLLSLFLLRPGARGELVIVEQGGRIVYRAPLEQERTLRLSGPQGETVLNIAGGHACIVSASCPHKVCMGMGEIARHGELLACVPNHLLVRIEGGEERDGDYDLLSR